MQLIVRLIFRLVGVVLICLALTVGWVMVDAHRTIGVETAASGERVAYELENLFWREILWRGSMRRDNVLPIPNWESLATLKLVSPGVCITFAPGAEEPRTMCSQLEGVGTPAPKWFSNLYEMVFGEQSPIARPLTVRQPETGAVVARADPAAAVRQAWRQTSIVASVAASMAIGICLLAALAIAHTLAPTQIIVNGLRQLENGNYRHRIKAFTRGEFGLIARAVNDLAERLTQSDRGARGAHESGCSRFRKKSAARWRATLHDEFGQCLTATVAFAASIEAEHPAIAPTSSKTHAPSPEWPSG